MAPVLCVSRGSLSRTEQSAISKPSPLRVAWPLKFVALFGDVPVTAASLRHLDGLLPPALGVAFYPHVHVALWASVAASLATFETALSSTSASAHIVPLLVAFPPYSTPRTRKDISRRPGRREEAAPNFRFTAF